MYLLTVDAKFTFQIEQPIAWVYTFLFFKFETAVIEKSEAAPHLKKQ